MRESARCANSLCLILSLLGCASQPKPLTPQPNGQRRVDNGAGVQGLCETPVAARTNNFGCYLLTETPVDSVPTGTVFWYLYSFPNRAAAEGARSAKGTVLESFGRIWLMTLGGEGWRSSTGEFVGRVGPIPLKPGTPYTVRYMEATFGPGMRTRVHRHSGPEAWFVLSGTQCLETPEGILVVRAGEGSVVREGPPMMLSSVGTEVRTALLIVVHDRQKRWSVAANDWTAKGICPN
jgi:mannose-6-phosphate isomerase-like protein (cupin superfamily)